MSEAFSLFKGISEPMSVAIIALAGVLISAIISATIAFVTSRKALYVNAVTVERSKWIEKLRGNLAKYSGGSGTITSSSCPIPSQGGMGES